MRKKITPECILCLLLHKRVGDAKRKCSQVRGEARAREAAPVARAVLRGWGRRSQGQDPGARGSLDAGVDAGQLMQARRREAASAHVQSVEGQERGPGQRAEVSPGEALLQGPSPNTDAVRVRQRASAPAVQSGRCERAGPTPGHPPEPGTDGVRGGSRSGSRAAYARGHPGCLRAAGSWRAGAPAESAWLSQ